MEGIGKLVESRLAAMSADRKRLTESWKPYIDSVGGYLSKQGKAPLSEVDKMNIARCLENALLEGGVRSRSKIFETTDSSAISFLGIQLPVIAALLPSLVLNKLAVTQALERRSGAVFYMDVKYGTAKGTITSTDTAMMSSTTGHNATRGGREYASVRVYQEAATGTGTSWTGKVTGYFPVVAGSFSLTNGTETFTDDGEGVLVSDLSSGDTGTLVYSTGAYTCTWADSTTSATVTYKYDWQTGGVAGSTSANVPEVNIAVTSSTITAEDFPLKANFTLGAAIDLNNSGSLYSDIKKTKLLNSVDNLVCVN